MESMLWTRLTDGRLRCGLCAHACVLSPGQRGRAVCAQPRGASALAGGRAGDGRTGRPVEKKPLYHFLPGSPDLFRGQCRMQFFLPASARTIIFPVTRWSRSASAGTKPRRRCWWRRPWRTACRSLAFTYNEPTVFVELLAATAALGQERGLPSILVSNGFMSPGCLELLGPLVRRPIST